MHAKFKQRLLHLIARPLQLAAHDGQRDVIASGAAQIAVVLRARSNERQKNNNNNKNKAGKTLTGVFFLKKKKKKKK
jgi:hypothetical protein